MLDLLLLAQSAGSAGLGSPAEIWQHIVDDFSNITEPSQLTAFGQVLAIDLLLAGDNAIVVGALAAGLPAADRKKVIMIGIGAALVLRIFFALIVTWLLSITGLVFAGGLLLVWVAWKFWRELQEGGSASGDEVAVKPVRSFAAAAWAVAVADVSMSLDNVLAVAGAAREHPGILVVGLILSVILMGVAANIIAKYIERHRWLGYLGLLVIVYVAGKMIYDGLVGGPDTIGLLSLFA
ncbi:YjbE family putative metal transport protein [Novosphingopyxis sp.]|uniref:YjbE family putative metal transport protein n=1 Tax=Novosphingopyxis sp. TaxID=2709690 RepID=UPI003B5C537C